MSITNPMMRSTAAPPIPMTSKNRNQLRRKMRNRRRSLTARQRQQSAIRASSLISRLPCFINAQRIAFYLPADGELDSLPLLERARQLGKRCYLPVLRPFKQQKLLFMPWKPGEPLIENKFGIAEPINSKSITPAWALDIVITPLVAFDEKGNRLGMGGGYYDRSFAYLQHRHHWRKPMLAGFAYKFQKVSRLQNKRWDVPLDLIITDKAVHKVRRKQIT